MTVLSVDEVIKVEGEHQTKMKVRIKAKPYITLIIGMSLLIMNINMAQDSTYALDMPGGIEATGEFSPSGPSQKKPERIEAGKSCIVDLIQSCKISGTLSGIIEFNYRILVKGPCGSPPGTFDEEWILTENSKVSLTALLYPE